MTQHAFAGLEPPVGKYKEIFDYVLRPDPQVKLVNLCCGLGFGKTDIAIQMAALTLNMDPNHRGLFLEPDWDRVEQIFWKKWIAHIPEELYTIRKGDNEIVWWNGATMIVRPRVITGAKSAARSKKRGIEFSFVIDDEAAISHDMEQFQNTYARVRVLCAVMYYLTVSTPLVGSYGRFLKTPGAKLFRGKTADNHYLLKHQPDYETRLRATMSAEQARRELDGELVALEGRIWKTFDYSKPWPDGNRCDFFPQFDPDEPWWVACDIGSSTGSYVVVQRTRAIHHGRELFRDPLWVAVADLCPNVDASAAGAFQRLAEEFGGGRFDMPAGVTGGADLETSSNTDGRTVAYFARQIWPGVRVHPVNEHWYSKQQQFNRLSYGVKSADNTRRFTVARNFVSLDTDSHRGLKEMFDEDTWPAIEERSPSHFLPKKPDIIVQHVRDAILMMSVAIMFPPSYNNPGDRPA